MTQKDSEGWMDNGSHSWVTLLPFVHQMMNSMVMTMMMVLVLMMIMAMMEVILVYSVVGQCGACGRRGVHRGLLCALD